MANRRIKDAIAQMRATFPDDDGTEIRLAEEVVALVEQYDDYQRMESEAKALKDECMVSLMALLGVHKTGIVKDWLVTWATSFKKEFVMPASKSRRFSVRRIS
jgi:hypothetical protein